LMVSIPRYYSFTPRIMTKQARVRGGEEGVKK
jgi:hypothetical protein